MDMREMLNDVTNRANCTNDNSDAGSDFNGEEGMVKGEARKWRNRARIKDNEIKLLRKMVASAKAENVKKDSNIVALQHAGSMGGNSNAAVMQGNVMAMAQRVMVLEQQEIPFVREQARKASVAVSHMQGQVAEHERAAEEARRALAARDLQISQQAQQIAALQQAAAQGQAAQQQYAALQRQHEALQQQHQQLRLMISQFYSGSSRGGAQQAQQVQHAQQQVQQVQHAQQQVQQLQQQHLKQGPGGVMTTPERRANTAGLLNPYMASTWALGAGAPAAGTGAPGAGSPDPEWGDDSGNYDGDFEFQGLPPGSSAEKMVERMVAGGCSPLFPSPSRLADLGFDESNSPITAFVRSGAGICSPLPCPAFAA